MAAPHAPVPVLASIDAALGWLHARGATALATDSRRVPAGGAFVAWPGYAQDGRQYVRGALDAGAAACLVEAEGLEAWDFGGDDRVAAFAGLKAATGPLASRFHGEPSARLRIVATTGTNGKTSTAWWVAQSLAALGQRCGVVGTLGVGEPPLGDAPGSVEPTGLTTPDPTTLQAALRRFADDGLAACAMEASSIGIVEHRLDGTRIEVAMFTNFTRDHLDYHGSMTAYWAAKEQLFAWPGLRAAAINVDDEQGAALAAMLRRQGLDVWSCSAQRDARLRADAVRYERGGLAFRLHEGDETVSVATGLIGDYNVSNVLVVIGALRALGVSLADAARVAAQLTPVPGRMQRVTIAASDEPLPEVVVDYAHTPDALEKALAALQPMAHARGGALWCVFGCGGNRDATKRPLMGAIARRLADHVIVTSDNPRDESPAHILAQIVAGMDGIPHVMEDRHAAIAHAIACAGPSDVVLIAGKGHEDYQEIGGRKLPFSDAEEARVALRRRTDQEARP